MSTCRATSGRSSSTLELEVFEENPIGRRFYAACGFEPVGSRLDEETGHRQLCLRLG